jgi:hypothetical protein
MTNIPVIMVLFSLSWVVGMGIYSVYSDCDPLKAGFTKSADSLLPFYVEDRNSLQQCINSQRLKSQFTCNCDLGRLFIKTASIPEHGR